MADARAMLDTAYASLDAHMAHREWAAVGQFSLTDCATPPSRFYADWCYRIDTSCANVIA